MVRCSVRSQTTLVMMEGGRVFYLGLLLAGLSGLALGTTVTTPIGDIIGNELTGTLEGKQVTCKSYSGIPFAEPPVGDLRFRPPVPRKTPFTEPFDARKWGNICLQNEAMFKQLSLFSMSEEDLKKVTMNEDCLNLNVWVPEGGEKQKAVLIYIHGGGFTRGAGLQYNAFRLAVTGDVIVVTVNYRLGIYGFYTSFDENARGNYGLLDQQLAFRWVKDNIGAFGGDKNRVAIGGESAGGVSVTWQMLAPSNEGLFQRAISESGTAFTTLPDQTIAKKYSTFLAEKLNCSDKDISKVVACLRALPAEAFRYNETDSGFPYRHELGLGEIVGGPMADGEFIPYSPTATAPGERMEDQPFFKSVDFIVGLNRFEGSPFVHMAMEPTYKAQTNKSLYDTGVPKDMVSFMLQMLEGKNIDNGLVDAIWWFYATSMNGDSTSLMSVKEFVELFGDVIFNEGSVKFLKRHAAGETKGNTYQYHFLPEPAEESGSMANMWGKEPAAKGSAIHGDNVGYYFSKYSEPDALGALAKVPKVHVDLGDNLITYWTNFAKTGNPNEPRPVPTQWPPYKPGEEKFIEFDIQDNQPVYSIDAFYRHRYISFWEEVVPLFRRTLVDSATKEKEEVVVDRGEKPSGTKDEL